MPSDAPPKICPTCLFNAQERRVLNPFGKTVAEHYRDLIGESNHSFNVLRDLPAERSGEARQEIGD
jgi:hypothetical protein